ncbi:hypothetical protein ARMGADRAFT_1034500 [Armillaria gallica]|uniref:Uncharacterized protein n=1 Tax=Armillaria gallica TaxID=47427 RepID=A0A2H3DKC2_ARMGA|nr:hypothetical protein ARMGADRAFT_1034500 [Armillaria gallica]
MSTSYVLLPLNKASALWDTNLYDMLSNPAIMSQVEEADVFLKVHWKAWMFGPDEVMKILKFLKEKTSPPELSSSTPKGSQPPNKRRTHDCSPLTQSPLTSKVKSEPSLPVKESSIASGKAPVCSHACKGGKIPIIEVLTLCQQKGITPSPTVVSEDTHVDPQSQSPTPITVELMLDQIFTDLPLLSALQLLHKEFLQVKGAHDMDAFENFAKEYSTGHHLLIDMGLVWDEDGVLQHVASPQIHHY